MMPFCVSSLYTHKTGYRRRMFRRLTTPLCHHSVPSIFCVCAAVEREREKVNVFSLSVIIYVIFTSTQFFDSDLQRNIFLSTEKGKTR